MVEGSQLRDSAGFSPDFAARPDCCAPYQCRLLDRPLRSSSACGRYHRRFVTLLDPIDLGPRTARHRVMLGPHVTNLGTGRALSERHVAYYRRRAVGGCGIIVVEEASVHASDWPYERAPLAEEAAPGWAKITTACHDEGALVIAALGHAGGQGSSAYSQRELWAPSRVPEVNSREVPKWMEPDDIEAVVAGFAEGSKLAVDAGCDGVEVNAGQHSLVRQFLSGLTNHRGDEWGVDRLRFARDVLGAVRGSIGRDHVVGLRLSCDELAPWAGITPDDAPGMAVALAELADYVVVVRGSIYSAEKTRPDFHEPPGFNIELTRRIRAALPESVAVVLQGSIIDPAQAEWALADGVADVVEMTRAQLSDPDLVAKLAAGTPDQIRPCILCNQTCQVRDPRNPLVSCVGEPSTGHELDDPLWYGRTAQPRDVLVVGAGPAGLECARVAATRGHRVRLVEQTDQVGGVATLRGPAGPLVEWLEAACRRLGVEVELGRSASATDLEAADVVVAAIGGKTGDHDYEVADGAVVLDVLDPEVLDGRLPARVAIWDPIGGPIAVALADQLGETATLVTPDAIAGNELSRTGDLAPANVRLQQRGVRIERRSNLIAVRPGEVEIEHRFSGARSVLAVDVLVDCGYRLPNEGVATARIRAGDCVAPRTIYEAILEGRRAALGVDRV